MSSDGAWRFRVLDYNIGFAQPWFFTFIALALALAVVAFFFALTRRQHLARIIPERLAGKLAPGVSIARPIIKAIAYGFSLTAFALALTQPQCGGISEPIKRRGIDVVVALDASKSMLARDVQPSRIERAKLELATLLDQLKGDRVGIVVFAGDAFIQCPLTSDYAAAKMFLRAIDPDDMPQGGTNIGAALQLSKQLLENADRGAKDRVVVLISDGEDLGGEVDDGVDAMKDAGAHVFAVGIGSESGEPIPLINKRGEVVGYKKDSAGNTVLTRLDRASLTRIAEATGGEFFYQPKSVAMGEVVARIDKMQKSELESRRVVRYSEGYQIFLAIGFPAFLLALMLRPSRRVTRRKDAPA